MTSLGGAVVAHLLRDVDDVARHRGGVDDDPAPTLPDHCPGRRLGGQVDAVDIGVLDALKLFQRHLKHRRDGDDPGVADRYVDATELRGHLLQHSGDLVGLGHITADGRNPATGRD